MTDDQPSQDQVRFQLSFALDRDRFFRRTCPSCGRDFKTQADEADLVASIQPAFRQAGLEIGATSSPPNDEEQFLTCPYCEYRAKLEDTLTQTFADYLQHYVMREYLLPKIHGMLDGFADDINKHRSPSRRSLISLGISVEYTQPVLSPRPISGPEPPDMTKVEMLCCGKVIKILDGWYALSICPYCGVYVALQ